jgi:hypothetical protein
MGIMTFTIIQTKTTPFADFNNGYLVVSGKSVPFNHPVFFDTIRDRLKIYMQKPAKDMKIDFNLSAINAVSKRAIMQTFRLLEEMNYDGVNVRVRWYYQHDDDDVQEFGEICQSTFKVPTEIRKIF